MPDSPDHTQTSDTAHRAWCEHCETSPELTSHHSAQHTISAAGGDLVAGLVATDPNPTQPRETFVTLTVDGVATYLPAAQAAQLAVRLLTLATEAGSAAVQDCFVPLVADLYHLAAVIERARRGAAQVPQRGQRRCAHADDHAGAHWVEQAGDDKRVEHRGEWACDSLPVPVPLHPQRPVLIGDPLEHGTSRVTVDGESVIPGEPLLVVTNILGVSDERRGRLRPHHDGTRVEDLEPVQDRTANRAGPGDHT
ncbi:MAG TPA: hypothetical protein VIY28_14945 [Pseudonocardiaceae bacterium]